MREKRLSSLIKKERKRLSRRGLRDQVLDWCRGIYYPSRSSISIITLLLVMTHLLIRWTAHFSKARDFAEVVRLQPVAIGVALIFVPVIVFAIGLSSRRTPSGVNAAEVLLKETFLFPIAILVVGLIANFTWVVTASVAKGVILLVAGLAVFTLHRLVQFLLDEHRQYQSGIHLLRDKIRQTILLAVEERIGKNLLLKQLESLPLEYSRFGLANDLGRTFLVKHPKQGAVHDVLLDKLADFANQLEKIANDNECAFAEKKVPRLAGASVLGPIREADEKNLRVVKERFLTVLYGDPVLVGQAQIVSFPHHLVTKSGDGAKGHAEVGPKQTRRQGRLPGWIGRSVPRLA